MQETNFYYGDNLQMQGKGIKIKAIHSLTHTHAGGNERGTKHVISLSAHETRKDRARKEQRLTVLFLLFCVQESQDYNAKPSS